MHLGIFRPCFWPLKLPGCTLEMVTEPLVSPLTPEPPQHTENKWNLGGDDSSSCSFSSISFCCAVSWSYSYIQNICTHCVTHIVSGCLHLRICSRTHTFQVTTCDHKFDTVCDPKICWEVWLLNSPSQFILELCIVLEQALTFHVILNTIPPGLFRASSPSNSFNFSVIRRLTQSLSSFRSTCTNHLNLLFFDHQTDWFQS